MKNHQLNTADAHRHRWAILGVLCISIFLVVVDNTIVNVALPTMARELHASTSDLQWIVDAYALVFSALLLAAGGLGDRWGRKRALQIGLILFGLTSLLAAASTTATQLILARGAMGVGAALAFPATLAILAQVFTDPHERAKAIGIWSAVVGLAVAAGPITGGALLERYWWGSVFFINVPIVAVALLAGRALIPDSRDPDAGPLDRVGLLLSSLAIGALVYTVIEAPEHGWLSAWTIAGFLAATVTGGVFLAFEQRVEDPLLDVTVFRNPRFTAASSAVTVAAFALVGMIFLMTQYLQFVRGDSTLAAGLHTLPFAVATIVMAPIAARMGVWVGVRPVITAGMALITVGLLLTSSLSQTSDYWTAVVPSMAALAAGVSAVLTPATDVIMSSVPAEKVGIGSTINDSTREIGGTLGIAVMGSIFASVYRKRIGEDLAGLDLDPTRAKAAEESIGAATAVAESSPGSGRFAVMDAAGDAFMAGMSLSMLIAAAVTTLGAAIAWTTLPGRATTVVSNNADELRAAVSCGTPTS